MEGGKKSAKIGDLKYPEPLRFYADRYSTDESNVKRWVRRGRAAAGGPDLPPLESATAMVTWWARHMKHRVPEKILEVQAAEMAAAPAAPAAPQLELESFTRHVAGAQSSPSPVDNRGEGTEVGRDSTLFRLREAEREAGAAYVAAVKGLAAYEAAKADAKGDTVKLEAAELLRVNAGDVEIKRRSWQELASELRLAEKTETQMAETRGDLLERGDVARAVRDVHEAQRTMFDTFFERVWPLISGKTAEEGKRIWEAESGRFLTAFPDELRFA